MMFSKVSLTGIALVLLAALNVQAYTCDCKGRTYDNSEIFAAVKLANQIDPTANPSDGTSFPHRYGNTPTDDYPWCGSGHYAEYPLVSVPPGPYDASAPYSPAAGPDRVVYLVGRRMTFCGCLTNEGQTDPDQLELCINDS